MTGSQQVKIRGKNFKSRTPNELVDIETEKKNQCFLAEGQASKRENGTRWDPRSMGTLGLWKAE